MWLRPLLLLLPSIAWAINYKCQNDQVLVVQSFGNDTIRMHCQKLDLCGYQRLRCDYDEHQPQCGGLMNFVAHVTQSSATSPVEHTCCNLFNPRPPHMVTTHVGNDCFIYELPDGSSVAKPKEDHPDDTPLTVLKSAAEIPEHIDHVSGYRLRLFHLKNKSPPTLLVKGIERRLDGYRVTICRPRCTSFQTATQERAANAGQREGTAADGSEWKVISWSSWTSSSWTTWANSVGAQGERTRTRTGEVAPKDADRAGSASTGAGTGANNINVDVDANGNNNNKFGGENRGGFDRPTVNGEGPGHINITIHTAGQGSGAGSGAGNGSGNGNGATPNINVSANASNVIHNHVPGSGNDGTGKGGNGDQSTSTGKKGGKGDGEGGDVGTGTGTGTGGGKKGSKGGDNGPETDVGGEEGPEKANGQDKTAKKPGHLGENSLGDGEDDKSGGEDGKGGKKSSGSGTGKETGSGDGSGSKNGEDNSLENGPKSAKGGDGSSGKKDKTGAGAGGQGGQGGNPDGDNGDLHASTGDKDGTNAAAGGNGKNSGLGGAGKDQGTGPATGKNKTGPSGKGDGDDEDLLKGDGGKGGSGSGGDGGKGGSGDKKKPGAGDAGGKNGDKGDLHASTGDGTNASTGGEDNGPNGKDGSDGPDAKNGSKNGKAGKNGLEGADKDKNGGKNGKNGAAGAGGKNGADENEIHAGPDGVDAAKGSGKKEGDEDGGKGGKKSGDGDEKDDKEPAVGLAGPGEINPDGGDNTEWAEGEDRLPKKPEDKKDGKDGSGKKDGESRSVPLKQERQAGGAVPAGEKSATGTGNGDGGPAGKTEEEAAKERLEHGEKDGGNGSEANFEEPEGADDKNKAAVAAGAAETGASDGAGGAIRTPDNRALKEKTDEEDGINEKASPNAEIQRAVESTEPMNPETPGAPANNGGTGTGTGSGEVHASPNDVNAGPSNTASDPGTGTVQNAQADPGPSSSAMLDAMKNMNCFPADAVVTTAYGKKRMDEVQVGDFVLVPSAGNVLKYERVEMFYHREESTRAQFVVIMTKSGKRMSLTPLHLLPFGQCEDVMRAMNSSEGLNELLGGSSFAHRAKIGDCVLSMTTDGELVADRITKVGRQYSTGIYSPMTVEGSLLVDGVLASCFSQLESHSVHKTVFDFLMYFRNLFGYEGHVHHEEQAIPSFITYVHDLSHYVLPFAKY